ncbi:MAG: cytochrome c biogenesis protein CcsA, partial [Leptonema sp. (in: Bacteria)]|nr:cytochrome c biogenesis protein CcsA [Leptonema sp. (in: bacteria)]
MTKYSIKILKPYQILVLVLAAFAMPAVVLLGLYYPPVIIEQGQAHRIFYIHVPVAWVALYSPIVAAYGGIMFLITREDRFDLLVVVAMRLALIFALGVVISGPLWASTEWGVYWNWKDSRLMSFFILILTVGGFFIVREFTEDIRKKAVFSSVMALLATLASGLTWFAIRVITPDTHPTSVIGAMSPKIRLTFWASVIGFHFF